MQEVGILKKFVCVYLLEHIQIKDDKATIFSLSREGN